MANLWTPPGYRPAGAVLPAGDVTLEGGTTLVYSARESAVQAAYMAAAGSAVVEAAVYNSRHGMHVIATIDPGQHGNLLHVSMSYKNRNPSWTEIRRVKDAFFGGERDAMMVLPRKEEYVNVHQHCFHIVEMPVAWGIM